MKNVERSVQCKQDRREIHSLRGWLASTLLTTSSLLGSSGVGYTYDRYTMAKEGGKGRKGERKKVASAVMVKVACTVPVVGDAYVCQMGRLTLLGCHHHPS